MLSRQRMWQIKNQESGRCTQCSATRISHHRFCDPCYVKYVVNRVLSYKRGDKKVTRCGICNTTGHNRRSCEMYQKVMKSVN